jgi:WD40 repeat protein
MAAHAGKITGMVEASEGRLATVGWDNTLRLWDLRKGKALYEIETTERLDVIAGGHHVVVTGSDCGTITAWHSDTGESVARWTASAAISALTMTSSPDGQRVVLAGDTSGNVHVLELRNLNP